MPIDDAELNHIVQQSNVEIILRPESSNKHRFKTFKDLFDFFNEERSFWQPYASGNIVLNSVNQIFNNLSAAQKANNGNEARSQISSAISNERNSPLIYSSTAAAETVVASFKRSPEAGRGSIAYFVNRLSDTNPFAGAGRDALDGIVRAAVINNPDLSGVEADKRSVS